MATPFFQPLICAFMDSKGISDISPLVNALNYLHPISAEIAAFFQERIFTLHCKKGIMLLNEGAVCEHVYFIKKGAIRGFIKSAGIDITTWISVENELVTSIAGLNIQRASLENMQTIEPCELLVMTFKDLEELYLTFPEFNIVGRKLLQLYYYDAESRAFISRLPVTEFRYKHFLEKYPHLINRIPLKYIASFLNMRFETLSRTRKNYMKKPNPLVEVA